jgi:hypothetical protein
MASVNKNFVVRNGLEVNTDLIYADVDTQRVGIGLSQPLASFHVLGDAIINPNLSVSQTLSAGNVDSSSGLFGSLSAGSANLTGATIGNLSVSNSASISNDLTVGDTLTVGKYAGDGSALVGIVTQIVAGPGISIDETQVPGKGVVTIQSFAPVGKTVFVTTNGDDANSGLSEADAKATIKGAASVALTRDTIKIYPGVYIEENPIVLNELVAVEGTELRNVVITPKFPERDMFYVNNGCHITDLSFIGQEARDGASMVALEKLSGTKEDRYFDAARMLRFNLDFLANESVGWLHSGYSGYAGDHLEQDASKKIEANINYIAAETVGFLTARNVGTLGYLGSNNQPFVISVNGSPTAPINCEDDVKDILRSLVNDLKSGSNKRSIGAARTYFSNAGALLHITGNDTNSNSILKATVDALTFAAGIATHVVNNIDWSTSITAVGFGTTTFANSSEYGSRGIYQDLSYDPLPGNCTIPLNKVKSNIGIVTNTLYQQYTSSNGLTYLSGITTTFGVNIDVKKDCVDDVKDVWKRIIYDLTRGGNSETIYAARSYYDDNWNLIPQILKNPAEVEQTIATLDHSFLLARSIINNNNFSYLSGRAAGISTYGKLVVSNALYDNHCGFMTVFIQDGNGNDVTVQDADIRPGDPIYFENLVFGCGSGPGFSTAYFPSEEAQTEYGGNYYGNIFCVFRLPQDNAFFSANPNTFEVLVGPSTIAHYFSGDDSAEAGAIGWSTVTAWPYSSGTIERRAQFTKNFTQVKDVAIQNDVSLGCEEFFPGGLNESVAGCKNVVSTIKNLVGVVTTILNDGIANGITTSFPGNRGEGIPFSNVKFVSDATYDEVFGKVIVTVPGLNAVKGDRIEIKDLVFSCSSGGPTTESVFPSGFYGYRFYIDEVNGDDYTLNVGVSTLPHTYERGGYVIDRTFNINAAPYDHVSGIVTITAPGAYVSRGDIVTIRDLTYSCSSGGPTITAIFPSESTQTQFGGKYYGNDFKVVDIVSDRLYNATNCQYTHTTGVTTITVTAPGFSVSVDDLVEIKDFEFTCASGAQTTPIYPSGKFGYVFKVYEVSGNTFTINTGIGPFPHTYVSGGTVRNVTQRKSSTFTLDVGISSIAHNYINGGYIIPPYSPGVGPITQGPYIRNCTNFVGNSIGMKVDGFDAEPGYEDDIGVTGTMSVDSYTQYNQGGIGVSITNGGYAQLVSIFTICDDIAIYTGTGGQCDLTNSNASFGNYGLYSEGVGNAQSKSIYHITGFVDETAQVEQDTVVIAGVGTYRPYDGQALYFGELFKSVKKLNVIDGGSGYSALVPPNVSVELPPIDSRGIRAEGSVNVDPITGSITSIDVISEGSQYRGVPVVTIDPPPLGSGGTQAIAQAEMQPTYYFVESATIPWNNGITGISTVVLTQNLNNTIEEDTTVYFSRLSLQIATTISFEWVGAGTNINTAKPALGGVTIAENEVVKLNGGQVVFTSTNQAGNFRIGTDLTINQLTGTITGRAFSQSLLQTVTPLIIALGR